MNPLFVVERSSVLSAGALRCEYILILTLLVSRKDIENLPAEIVGEIK